MIFSEIESKNIENVVDNLSGHTKALRKIDQLIDLIPDDNEIVLLGDPL